MFYKIGEAVKLYRAGAVSNAQILPVEMSDKWHLTFDVNAEGKSTLQTKTGSRKEYKTIQAALNDAQRVGFGEARVSLR